MEMKTGIFSHGATEGTERARCPDFVPSVSPWLK